MLCSNYRHISIFSIFSKIFKKLTHKRLISFLDRYDILYKYEYGSKESNQQIMQYFTYILI